MSCTDLGGFRKVSFNIADAEGGGLQFPIGRASLKDPERFDRENNFLFHEKSLSKKHALLCIKRLLPAEKDPYVPLLDQFRISVQDLGSTHGLVDLQSQDADAKIIDLKNGERFGLIKLYQPVAAGQSRGAKLKFQVSLKTNEARPDSGTLDLFLSNVTYEDSPYVSRPPTMGRTEAVSSPSSSSSDLNFSEEFGLELDTCERDSTPRNCDVDHKVVLLDDEPNHNGESERSINLEMEVEDVEEYGGEVSSQEQSEDDTELLTEKSVCPTLFVARENSELKVSEAVISVEEPPSYKDLPVAEISASRDVTPQCYDCATAVDLPDEDNSDALPINVFCQSSRKRRLETEDEARPVMTDDFKRAKVGPIIGDQPQAMPVDTKKVIIGGMIGFLAGSVGTLGLLVGIANMG
ncbi:LAME_0B03774g1_1 [Lachancea meyersii CBS 8951]|uniref:LAME_0B03774g1_1 n=1 Tax=Lachancea meyersii CBS 8951 TaxID=1266667 RepID=A0A1G4IUD7_9SACH|nr:LAME_0B03774g1_1 [Lachancea meyersii CBS 8951]